MRKNAESGQSGGESARDAVRYGEIEGCYPPFAEPDQKDGSEQDCQKQGDRCDDRHVQLSSQYAPEAKSTTWHDVLSSGTVN
jgi:hypothetical protein